MHTAATKLHKVATTGVGSTSRSIKIHSSALGNDEDALCIGAGGVAKESCQKSCGGLDGQIVASMCAAVLRGPGAEFLSL